jgi:hypothetical protein
LIVKASRRAVLHTQVRADKDDNLFFSFYVTLAIRAPRTIAPQTLSLTARIITVCGRQRPLAFVQMPNAHSPGLAVR